MPPIQSWPCPAEIRKLIDALVQADRAVDVKAHHVGIAPGPDNLFGRLVVLQI